VRNFVGVIDDISPESSLVETELFPEGALHYYTKKNMGWDYTKEEYDTWQLADRGGAQGDYRDGMQAKIANVIDCLRTEPLSKRAVIPIPFNSEGSETADWRDQGQVPLGDRNRCASSRNVNVSCLSFTSSHKVHCHCIYIYSEQMLQRAALLHGGRETEVHRDRSHAECEHFCQEHSLLLRFDRSRSEGTKRSCWRIHSLDHKPLPRSDCDELLSIPSSACRFGSLTHGNTLAIVPVSIQRMMRCSFASFVHLCS
jgi:hypothetical protein